VIDLICRQTTELAGADYAGIRLITEEGSLRWAGMWGNRSDTWRQRSGTRGTGSASQALAAGRTIIVRTEEVRASGARVGPDSVRENEGGVVVLATPLTYSGRKLGALVCGWRTDITPSGEQIRVAEVLAGYGAAVIDNANSHAESERRRAEAEALANLVAQGAAEQDPEQAIVLICEQGRELVGADYASVSLVEKDNQRVWHGVAGMSTEGQTASRGRGVGPTAQALAAGHALVFERLDEKEDFSRFHNKEGGKTAIAAPCVGRRGLRGALHLGWRTNVTITLSQLRVAEALASYAAIVLENARSHAALEERAEALAASEERYRRLSEELEVRVQERTSELQVANQELEAFSYSVSHDLRAPLRSMDGFCQVLIEDYGDVLDETGHDYLNRVRAASQRMAELIDGLLALSRVTRTQLTPEPVDLSALASSILDALAEAEPGRSLTAIVAPDLTARGDPRLLRIVLENLLRNAWKFTARHTSARIEFGACEEDGQRVYFVRDDGAGFDMTYKEKLFGPFQRLHGMTEFEGTGIGLATVQRIIHRHGGRVWAEGEVEQGATFYFTLSDTSSASPT
ncbi:MAG TPA: ATP-binding protein, partial [Chloroflexota bacterium]|nr:ATP-binding protein [Chloroflexota bacterium]